MSLWVNLARFGVLLLFLFGDLRSDHRWLFGFWFRHRYRLFDSFREALRPRYRFGCFCFVFVLSVIIWVLFWGVGIQVGLGHGMKRSNILVLMVLLGGIAFSIWGTCRKLYFWNRCQLIITFRVFFNWVGLRLLAGLGPRRNWTQVDFACGSLLTLLLDRPVSLGRGILAFGDPDIRGLLLFLDLP